MNMIDTIVPTPTDTAEPLVEERTPKMSARRKVDLPQPEGPMNAVTYSLGISIETSSIACLAP